MMKLSNRGLLCAAALLMLLAMVAVAGCSGDAAEDPDEVNEPASEPEDDPEEEEEPKEDEQDPHTPSLGEGEWTELGDPWAMVDKFTLLQWQTTGGIDDDADTFTWGLRNEGHEVVEDQDATKIVLYAEDDESILWLGEEPGDWVRVKMRGETFTGEEAEMFGGMAMMGPFASLMFFNQQEMLEVLTGTRDRAYFTWEVVSEESETIGDGSFDVTRVSIMPDDTAGLQEVKMELAMADIDGSLMIIDWLTYAKDLEGNEEYHRLEVVDLARH